jgi:putative heme-binding domain-containing protein
LPELIRNKVDLDEATTLIVKRAAQDPGLRTATVELLSGRARLSEAAIELLGTVAASEGDEPALRARALRGLMRARSSSQPAANRAVIAALATVGQRDNPPAPVELRAAWQEFVQLHLKNADPEVRQAASSAAHRLGLDRTHARQGPPIATLDFERVVAGVQRTKGDPELGSLLFQKLGCTACHTISKTEPLKGPFLGDIANRYSRAELTESILKPSARIAQGFETQKFATTAGQVIEGFVVRESGDEVELRGGNGAVTVLPKADIDERAASALSVMPTGLADPLTIPELAAILAYLERLRDGG